MKHALFLCLLLLPQDDPKLDEKKVRELIDRLGAEKLEDRDAAEGELTAMGEAVVPFLEKARSGADKETTARIDKIVGDLTLAKRWAKELAEEEEPGNAYQKLENAMRQRSFDKRQAARIASATLLYEGVSTELRHYVFSFIDRYKLRDTWPALVQLALREDSDADNALSYLQRLKPPKEAADALVALIPKLRNRSVVYQLIELLRGMRLEKAKLDAVVGGVLEAEGDDEAKGYLLSYISQGRLTAPLRSLLKLWRSGHVYRMYQLREAILRTAPDESAKELLEGLRGPDLEEVQLAADYAARHKIADAALLLVDALGRWPADERAARPKIVAALRAVGVEKQIEKWLASDGPPARATVLALVADLELRAAADQVTPFLEHRDAAIRRQAARTLGQLRHAAAAGALEKHLSDEDATVAGEALKALARIRGGALTKTVLEKLLSENADLQAAALEVLASMDTAAVLDELTKEQTVTRHIARYAIAVLIVQGGEAVLHRVMARVGTKISAEELNSMVRLIQAARGGR